MAGAECNCQGLNYLRVSLNDRERVELSLDWRSTGGAWSCRPGAFLSTVGRYGPDAVSVTVVCYVS